MVCRRLGHGPEFTTDLRFTDEKSERAVLFDHRWVNNRWGSADLTDRPGASGFAGRPGAAGDPLEAVNQAWPGEEYVARWPSLRLPEGL